MKRKKSMYTLSSSYRRRKMRRRRIFNFRMRRKANKTYKYWGV